MLESLLFIASSWLMTAAADAVAKERIAVDESILKTAGLPADNEALLGFFKKRTLPDRDREPVRKLIRQLGSETYRLRERAMAELIGRGPAVVQMLQEVVKDKDLEIARRAEKCLARIQEKEVAPEVLPAAARLLAARKPAGAVETMLAYTPHLPYADEESNIAEEARNLLTSLAKQDGKPHPAIIRALSDSLPARRAAAGEALCRARLIDDKHAVRKLLADPDPFVRLRLALALAHARDKEAIPVLIDTLPRRPQSLGQAGRREGRRATAEGQADTQTGAAAP
jgi:hypothetical protein